MKTNRKDRAAVRFPPPLVFLLAIVAGVVLQRMVLPLPLGLAEIIRTPAAMGALLFGAGFVISAIALFRRTGQDPSPWKSTPELIFRGPYRITRNPMYLGIALLQAGAGLWRSNGWILVLLPVALLGVYWIAIRHEEAYLEHKFGDAYLSYRSSVRRWL